MTRSALEKAGLKSRTDHINSTVQKIIVSPIKEIAMLASEVPDCVPLAWGIPFFDTPPHIRQALKDALDNDPLLGRYSPSLGLPELREAISANLHKKYGITVNPRRELLVTAGAMEGLMDVMQAIVNPGDEVIITSPGFSSYSEQIMLAGGIPRYLPLIESKGWHMDISKLPSLINAKTKAFLLNSPCNPTGTIFTREELAAVKELVLKHNLILITDEPYNFLTYDGHDLPELVSDDSLRYNRVSCFSFSKEYAMTGYRVGYVFAEEGMIRQLLKIHDSFIVSAPRPSQVAALAALQGDQSCVAELRQTLQDRRNLLCKHLDAMSDWFSYVRPEGAYYIFAKFLKGDIDDVKMAVDLVKEAHVAIVPGSAFGPEGKNHFRFCFGCTPDKITLGMERLEKWLMSSV